MDGLAVNRSLPASDTGANYHTRARSLYDLS